MTAWEACRWATIVLASTSVLVGTPQWGHWWRTMDARLLQGRMALALYNVAALYGTGEALARGVPGGPRVVVFTVAALWCCYAVCWEPAQHAYRHVRRGRRARHPRSA